MELSTMSDEVRAEYLSILAEVVLAKGTLVKEKPTEYGWAEYDHRNGYAPLHVHHLRCPIADRGQPEEVRWDEFVGTFAPGGPNEARHGVDLPGVTCRCGRLKDRTIRVSEPVSELMTEIFTRLHQRLQAERVRSRNGLADWPDPDARPSY